MRKTALLFVLLIANAPAYAQTTSGAQSSVNISNPASTETKAKLITPPTVVAPGLAAAGMETCLGSASGGMSLMGLGLTFGRTTPDEGCAIRLYARQLHAFGYPKAAMALMCRDPRVAEAMVAVGQGCPFASTEIAPRRRPKVAQLTTSFVARSVDDDDITGSIGRPRNTVVKPWINPDIVLAQARAQARMQGGAKARVQVRNRVLALAPVEDSAATPITASEEGWFTRASEVY